MTISGKRLYGLVGGCALLGVLGSLMIAYGIGRGGASPRHDSVGSRRIPGTSTPIGSPSATPSATPAHSPTPPPASITLTLQGATFYSRGRPITLVGASHSSLEYSCTGDGHYAASDYHAMRSWGMNVVRIPLSSAYWAYTSSVCPAYRTTVASAVAAARAAGLFVILDLQWSAPMPMPGSPGNGGAQCPMPDNGNDLAMWRTLATMYHQDTGVLFDLYGEPHGVSWSLWLNGGTVAVSSNASCFGGPGRVQSGTYQGIGMRALVSDIRAIAPSNIIIVGGLDWGFDLSGITNGYAVPGSNIVYATHPWDHADKVQADWGWAFGTAVAHHYPVIADEFGAYDCGTSYVADAIAYFNAHGMSWLAWNWLPGPCSGSGPTIISSWSGTPNGPYGTYIRDQMLAESQRTG
jgi:aryl-phospho-beta-D-glucosidase BglC (GH1 family)